MLKNTRISDLAQFFDLQNGCLQSLTIYRQIVWELWENEIPQFFSPFHVVRHVHLPRKHICAARSSTCAMKTEKKCRFLLKVLRISQLSLFHL